MPPKRRNNDESASSSSAKKRHTDEDQASAQTQNNNVSPRELAIKSQSIRSGKLIRVHLTNFMCHSNLVMDFNSRVNLLIGSNGSGKSAILTALIIGLGAKANKTNRSTNLKNLIKTGENSATIEVEIANNGTDAYEFNTYGKKITVERKILASGGSNYKIKNARGDLVSKSRDDLMKILLYHNIQTDNPVFVLNQDAARSFLKELDPFKNYTLFLKATQMELILDKLNKCAHLYTNYKAKLTTSRKQLKFYENEVTELRTKYETLLSVEDFKMAIHRYKLELVWLFVTENENAIKELQTDIHVKQFERNEIISKIEENQSETEIQGTLRNLEKEIKEKNSRIQKENRTLLELRENHKEENLKYQSEAQHTAQLKQKIKHFENQIKAIESDISERTETCTSRNSRMRKENEKKLQQLEQKRKDILALVDTLKFELTNIENNKERQKDEYQTLNLQKSGMQSKISANQQELNRIASSSNDRMDVYGAHMNGLLQAIERAHKAKQFSEMPRGPLGRYLEVSDRKWRGVVEKLVAGLLTSFVVNNAQDRRVLDRLIKTNFPQARHTIITSKFHNKVYDVREGSVPKIRGTHLLKDMIKCSDPIVINCLIDQIHCEQILLVEDQELAVSLTSERSQVPANLIKVILLDPLLEYYPAPMYRVYSLNPRTPRYIQVNMDERKLILEDKIRKNEENRIELDVKLQDLRKSLGDFDEYQKKKHELLRKHESSLNKLRMQIEELNNIEYPSENEDEILRSELKTLQKKTTEMLVRLTEKEAACMTLKDSILEKDKYVRKQQDLIQSCVDELNTLTEELNTKRYEITTLDNNVRIWNSKLVKIDDAIAQIQNSVDLKEQQLKECEERALAAGNRLHTELSQSQLNNRIKEMETKVKELCSSGENIAELKATLDDKELALKGQRACIDSITGVLDLLKKSRQQRFKMIKCVQEHMALRVSHTFKHVLQIRQFDGEVEVDHMKKTLTMSIVPRDKHIENAVSSTKSLSGGERSYATIALLLSLWSCVDHSFYFLDEYDVFTDQFNREIMTQLLLNEAKKKPHRQYTFLTPQDMSFIEASDTVKIHRLSDPRIQQNT